MGCIFYLMESDMNRWIMGCIFYLMVSDWHEQVDNGVYILCHRVWLTWTGGQWGVYFISWCLTDLSVWLTCHRVWLTWTGGQWGVYFISWCLTDLNRAGNGGRQSGRLEQGRWFGVFFIWRNPLLGDLNRVGRYSPWFSNQNVSWCRSWCWCWCWGCCRCGADGVGDTPWPEGWRGCCQLCPRAADAAANNWNLWWQDAGWVQFVCGWVQVFVVVVVVGGGGGGSGGGGLCLCECVCACMCVCFTFHYCSVPYKKAPLCFVKPAVVEEIRCLLMRRKEEEEKEKKKRNGQWHIKSFCLQRALCVWTPMSRFTDQESRWVSGPKWRTSTPSRGSAKPLVRHDYYCIVITAFGQTWLLLYCHYSHWSDMIITVLQSLQPLVRHEYYCVVVITAIVQTWLLLYCHYSHWSDMIITVL